MRGSAWLVLLLGTSAAPGESRLPPAPVLGCTPAQRPVMAVDVPPREALSAEAALPPPPEAKVCERRVRLATLAPETPTCQVFGLKIGAQGVLRVPCNGTGPAEARLEPYEFSGSMTSGALRLENQHTEDIGDGCSWRFFQEISGSGEKLKFLYKEQIEGGDACYRPCGASGDVEVVR